MASGFASISACTTEPASILPSAGACSATNCAPGWAFAISFLNEAVADWPYS